MITSAANEQCECLQDNLVDQALIERLLAMPRYRQVPGFSLAQLLACGELRILNAGQTILIEGEPAAALFLVLGGRFKMWRHLDHGRNALLALFHFGDPVGISTLGGRNSPATVEALDGAVCLEVPYPAFIELMEKCPSLMGDLLPPLLEQVAECNNCLVEATFVRVEQRLARLLLKLGQAAGRPQQDGVFVPLSLSRQDLADMTGTRLETAIRIMSKWNKLGLVETRRDGFLLLDSSKLATLGS